MLCPSQMTPTVSAYTYLWGQHDYNSNPFMPLGCKVEAHLVPGIRETWAPHTTGGFYVGNSWEHYCCHEVFSSDTRHTRICSTVFFKRKYLTMPTLTPSDALIRAANNLTDAIAGIIPPPNMTTNAIDQLINIFKLQAKKDKDVATAQRVSKEHVQAERVCTKTKDQSPSMAPNAKPTTTTVTTPMSFPPLKVEYPDLNTGMLRGTPMISQDEMGNNLSPAANTCLQPKVRTITQDYLFHLMDTPGLPRLFPNQQAASCKYPLQFLCDFANAVLDDETGDLLEYRHLLKHPKYKEVWSKSFGKEIWCLATTTKTIAFIEKQRIPQARRKDITYGQIVCVYHLEKKDPYRTRIMMDGSLVNTPMTVVHQPQTSSPSNSCSTASSPPPMQSS